MSAAPPPPPAHDPPVPIAAPTTAADPTTATALPAFLAIPTVKNLLNNPRLNKVFFHLFHHGYVTNSVDKILENFVDVLVDRKEHLRQAGVPTWDDFAKELPFHFPSECCTFVYGDNLYLFGPRGVYTILPSGDILHTVEIGFMEVPLGTESQVEMKAAAREIHITGDDTPPAGVLFRKMPHFFLLGGTLHLIFEEEMTVVMARLDLQTFDFSRVPISGDPLVVPRAGVVATESALHGDNFYLWFGSDATYRLGFLAAQPAWERVPCFGLGPASFTGNSLVWDNSLWVIPSTVPTVTSTIAISEPTAFSLSLSDFEWKKHTLTGNIPRMVPRDCYLGRLHGSEVVYLKKTDCSELWVLDLPTKAWHNKKSQGLRPGNYTSNPSYAIHGDELYCLGGQRSIQVEKKNHIHKLSLRYTKVTTEMRLRSKISMMHQDPFCDVVFRFRDDARHVRAHRSILCHFDFFAAMFNGRFAEAALQPVMVYGQEVSCHSVLIHDTDYVTFSALVEFMYEKLDLDSTEADPVELYQLADMYLIPELMEEVVDYIEDVLNIEAAKAIMAEEDSVKYSLKRKLMNVIYEDPENKVLRTN